MAAEIVPASNAAELLRRSLARGRLGHAYLFSGDDLDTLTTAAIDLAQLLICEAPPERAPNGSPLSACGVCRQCRRIAAYAHPDVTWVHPESKIRQITVDQTREVIRTLNLRPAEATRKFAIFAGADRFNTSAANSFLKTLEEPPAGSVILLLSTEPDRLLQTILSRCLRLNFGVGTVRLTEAVRQWVVGFAGAVAETSQGLFPRYRLLGNLVQALIEIRSSLEEAFTRETPLTRYPDAASEQKEQWERELTAAIEAEYRRRRGEFLSGLQAWLRDLWLIADGHGAAPLFLPEAEGFSRTVAARLDARTALRNLEAWEQSQRLMYTNVQESLALEVGLLRLRL